MTESSCGATRIMLAAFPSSDTSAPCPLDARPTGTRTSHGDNCHSTLLSICSWRGETKGGGGAEGRREVGQTNEPFLVPSGEGQNFWPGEDRTGRLGPRTGTSHTQGGTAGVRGKREGRVGTEEALARARSGGARPGLAGPGKRVPPKLEAFMIAWPRAAAPLPPPGPPRPPPPASPRVNYSPHFMAPIVFVIVNSELGVPVGWGGPHRHRPRAARGEEP